MNTPESFDTVKREFRWIGWRVKAHTSQGGRYNGEQEREPKAMLRYRPLTEAAGFSKPAIERHAKEERSEVPPLDSGWRHGLGADAR